MASSDEGGSAANPQATPTHGRTWIPTVALVAVTAIWGTTFVVVAFTIEQLPVYTFLAWRFGIAALLLFAVRPHSVRSLSRVEVRRGLAIGVTLGIGYVLQTLGLQYTSATVSGFITGMFLVFTPLVAWLTTRERIAPAAWIAVLVATIGLALISLQGAANNTLGVLLTLGGALAFAFQIVGLSQWSTTANAYGLAVLQLGMVAVMCAVIAPFEEGPKVPPNLQVWAAVLFLALAATALAFVVQSWAQAQISPTKAAVVLTMEPVFAGVTGFLAGDDLTWRLVLGGMMVVSSMYLVEVGTRRGRDAEVAHLEP